MRFEHGMRSLAVGSLVFLLGSLAAIEEADAGVINTPPMTRDFGDGMGCVVANTGNKAVGPITFTIFRRSGVVAKTSIVSSLDANAMVGLAAFGADFGLSDDIAYCRVEGKGISKNRTPVTLCSLSGVSTSCQVAVSSR